ncbi:MAG: SLC13 family permease [candidate division WOR-3 bacterium]|nr:SLC13 family permease [candidate division WOR-3 bacterium]MDW7987527.1 SLC13 family permease [candidate division WOR-3 bacterium]
MITTQLITCGIFIFAYAIIVFFHRLRTWAVWGSVFLYLVLNVFEPKDIILYIDWNILGVLLGTSIVAELFIYSKIPAYIAERLVDRTRSLLSALLVLSSFTGLLSAFIENVSTTLIMAPIAFEIAAKQKTSPVPFIMGICLSANLQGTATLVGDPPSMILAAHTNMSFNDFFVFNSKPGLFFAVQIGALASLGILYLLYRKTNKPFIPIVPEKVISWIPGIILLLLIFSLVFVSFFRNRIGNIAGVICLLYALVAVLYAQISKKFNDGRYKIIKTADFGTVFFLAGIFCLVGALRKTGIIHLLADKLGLLLQGNLLGVYALLTLSSMIISGFVDNIPYFAAVVGVISNLAETFAYPKYLLLFGTIIATTVGGNITPIGASANIVGTGLLRKRGYKLTFWDFMKIGLPFSLVATLAASLFLWIFWH